MEKVEKVTSPELAKNDLKSSEYVKREKKKDKNNGRGFREVFFRIHRERAKGNWFEDNYNKENDEKKENLTEQHADSNIGINELSRQALRGRIKINTEVAILKASQKENSKTDNNDKNKEESK